MQTPQSGTDFAIDGWVDSSHATFGESAHFLSTSRRHLVWMGFILVTTVAAFGGALWSRVTTERYSTQIGELGFVELPDGSMAILNTSTEIEVAFTRSTRRVKLLSGEALFDVATDSKRPFVTEAAGFHVETQGDSAGLPRKGAAAVGWLVDYARDVATPLTRRTSHTLFATRGTTFSVRCKPRYAIELVVLEGFAELRGRAPGEANPATISEDTLVQASVNGPPEKVHMESLDLAGKMAWLNRRLVFRAGDDLHKAAEEFNRYNEVHIIVERSIGGRQIRGSFNVNRPDEFVASIQLATNAQAHVSGNLITVRDSDAAIVQ
jgi:ferric-dicitrate binding protein FerR (iron transport regulator)